MGQCYVAVNCYALEKKSCLNSRLANQYLTYFPLLSTRSHFDNSAKQGTNLDTSAGGGELFEKFQQKQKINKDGSGSMGGKRYEFI
jgi:hypothetical protein